ncbi:MAG: lytic transglycosylase domain-containing protein [Nitrosomonas sp.]|nr:lytic transglycosylase domain-containing protein [Nitrosomonas sp.]
MKKLLSGLLLLFYIGAVSANPDNDFLAARDAYHKGDTARLVSTANRLQTHVLAPFVNYYQLRRRLINLDANTIKSFISQNEDSVVSDRLRGEWLKILGERQQWQLFSEQYAELVDKNMDLLCYSMQERLFNGDANAAFQARQLWFTPYSMPNSCSPVFEALIAKGSISKEDVWTRIRLSLETGQTSVAKYINRHLSEDQALSLTRLEISATNPLRYLEQLTEIKTRSDREIALFAIQNLLLSDTNRAYALWLNIHQQFPAADQSYFYGRLAFRAALRHDSRALGWFTKARNNANKLTEEQLAWKARTALREENWEILLEAIESMPILTQQTDVWRYWAARALLGQSRHKDANAILPLLSNTPSYYGQLAKEALGTTFEVPERSRETSTEEIEAIEQLPGIQRALNLYRLNLRIDAAREWNWAIRHFDDAQLLAAANVAYQHGIYDRAISTAKKTVSHHDYNLRFITPHRNQLQAILQPHDLDEAWVYGLIRQESRFISSANSSAGAMGLMQVMPATAKWVAEQMGMKDYRQNLAVDITTNLKLGAYYLKHVLTILDDQPLLASAAYNAGPGQAKRWRATRPLEGAIYAETIPYRETRDYVKKVLHNSMYYAKVLEQGEAAPTLKQRLGVVAPK